MTRKNERDISINKRNLGIKYTCIGVGDEGRVFRYDDNIAFKIYHCNQYSQNKIKKIYKKVCEMFEEDIDSFCFPRGFVTQGRKVIGFFFEHVEYNEGLRDFDDLEDCDNTSEVLNYILQADRAIQEAHEKGIIIGDIKGDNIMINQEGLIKFIDTDNYIYHDYDFNIAPSRFHWLNIMYEHNNDPIDNDIFVFSLMTLFLLTKDPVFILHHNKTLLDRTISCLDVDSEIKDGLQLIFSDAHNKPYIGDILKLFDEDGLAKIKKK